MKKKRVLRHASLFSGIGGFDLAAEWMGWENVLHCEWNPFGRAVLNYYWPEAASYEDITKTDFTPHRGAVDILTGGFPCQPYSSAGKRLGKEDDRHLWPQMLRAIREIRPTWVVGENVYGLVNWNNGLVFDEIQADLEAEGYTCQPVVIPACAVNAPHRRDRIWFVAYADSQRYSITTNRENSGEKWKNGKTKQSLTKDFRSKINRYSKAFTYPSNPRLKSVRRERKNAVCGFGDVANTQRQRLERSTRKSIQRRSDGFAWISNGNVANTQRLRQPRQRRTERHGGAKAYRGWKASWAINDSRWPTESPICSRDDGFSFRLAGKTFSKAYYRAECLKAYGNAIVPQVALEIFKAIEGTILTLEQDF